MDIFFWILQVVAAVAFLMAGSMKLIRTKEQLAGMMGWVEDYSRTQIRLIGAAEILGALGLILPPLTRILPWLAPVAAAALVVLMAGAAYVHYQRKEMSKLTAPVVLLLLSALIAIGRFWIAPF